MRMDKIDGVRVVPLKLIRNERGRLIEVQRRDDAHFLGFGQAYVTTICRASSRRGIGMRGR